MGMSAYLKEAEAEAESRKQKAISHLIASVREMAAEEGQVISCHSVEAWNEQLQKGNDSNNLVILICVI